MRFAVIRNNQVEQVIIANENQKEELEIGLSCKLEDASIYALQIGDLWVEGKGWTRNRNGEQIILEKLPPEEWSQYQALSDELEHVKAISITEEEASQAYAEGVNSL